jgi:hypothetical protein
MIKKQSIGKEPIGTLCFLPDDDIGAILLKAKEIADSIDGQWRCLILLSRTPSDRQQLKELRELCEISSLVEHIVVKWDEKLKKIHSGTGVDLPGAATILYAIKSVKTKFISFVDAAHSISIEGLKSITKTLHERPDLGAIRGVISSSNKAEFIEEKIFSNRLFKPGDGIREFGLFSLSSIGVIYNIGIMKSSRVLEQFEDNIRAHKDYPFLCLNILLTANSSTYLSSEIICNEIKLSNVETAKASDYFSWRSYGRRCDQILALRNTLFQGFQASQKITNAANFDHGGFYTSFIELYVKMLNSIMKENGRVYSDQMMSTNLTVSSFSLFCLGAIEGGPKYRVFDKTIKEAFSIAADRFSRVVQEPNGDVSKLKLQDTTTPFYSNYS